MKKYGIFAILLVSGLFHETHAIPSEVRKELTAVAEELQEDAVSGVLMGGTVMFASGVIGLGAACLYDAKRFDIPVAGYLCGLAVGYGAWKYISNAALKKSAQSRIILNCLDKIK
jgi:hypothetical protein